MEQIKLNSIGHVFVEQVNNVFIPLNCIIQIILNILFDTNLIISIFLYFV